MASCGDEPQAPKPVPAVAPSVPTPPAGPNVKALLEACRNECKLAFSVQNREETLVLDWLDAAVSRPWTDAAEYARLQAVVATIREREARMAGDPRYLEAEKKKNWIRENPIFKEFEITWAFADPYVVFQQVKRQDVRDTKRVVDPKAGFVTETPIDGTVNPAKVAQNAEWATKGDLLAKREAALLVELDRRFRELFADGFKLPTLAAKGRVLTALVMWDRPSFDKLNVEAGRPVGAGTRSVYSPTQQKVITYVGDEALQGRDELRSADGRVQKEGDHAVAHAGASQLLHEYGAVFRGAPLKDGDSLVPDGKAVWFDVGLAEWMSALESGGADAADPKWRHGRVLLDRIDEGRRRRDDCGRWTIRELLKPNDGGEILRLGQKLAAGSGWNMGSHFACRAWALVHFLWNYDGGKYRPQFVAYLREVLAGKPSSATFAQIMGRRGDDDWGPVEKQFEWYWGRLLALPSEAPSTEPPAGRMEDDLAFDLDWDAKRKADRK